MRRSRLADGRIVDRHSGSLYDVQRQYLGRVWFFRDITEKQARRRTHRRHGAHRFAHRPAQPRRLPRPPRPGIRARAAQPHAFRRALSRPRPLQGHQRHARPSDRRPALARGQRAAEANACAKPTWWRVSAATNSRCCRSISATTPTASRRWRARSATSSPGPYADRRQPGDHQRQHRRGALSRRHRRHRRHDDEGGSRPLPRQERGPQPVPLPRRRARRGDARTRDHHRGFAARDRARRARAVLSAAGGARIHGRSSGWKRSSAGTTRPAA